jgi:hypothetical protein
VESPDFSCSSLPHLPFNTVGISAWVMSNPANDEMTQLLLSLNRRLDELLIRVETMEEIMRANKIQPVEIPTPVGHPSLNQFIPTGDSEFPRL